MFSQEPPAQGKRDRDCALKITAIDFRWPGNRHFQITIESFNVKRGERLLLLGPSGSGKSTLLSLICGIMTAQEGQIEVLGKDIAAMGAAVRDRYRAEHFGIIFQMFNLLPYANALDNVLLPLSFAPARWERAGRKGTVSAEAGRLLSALGLDEALATRGLAAELSVGQQQRVAAARALIGAPELIIADEPTSALDSAAQKNFLDLLFKQIEEAGATLILVSHDERLATLFDRAVSLKQIAKISVGAAP